MSRSFSSRIAGWLKTPRDNALTDPSGRTAREAASLGSVQLTNPVENYYRHKAKHSLPYFYQFALQTRSLAIRDIFAKIATTRSLGLADLLTVIEHESSRELTDIAKHALAETFDYEILLALADLLANSARDEWDTHNAVLIYDFVRQIVGNVPFSERNKLQYVEALHEIQRYDDAESLGDVFDLNELAPCQQELLNLQRMRKTAATPDQWISALNEVYSQLGMAPVRFLDDGSMPLMDRLSAETGEPVNGPKISVIMPTFSPGVGIYTAIRSLLEQSWQNTEIIILNDASPTKYNGLFAELQALDPRIHVLHQQENTGAYVARNAGLAAATGEFITTHDDDDWSHPDKLAIQVKAMLENPEVVATTSAHIRTSENLAFRRLNIQAQYMQLNYSSLMYRHWVADEIGPWDTVNRGGDSEFLTRLIEHYDEEQVVHLLDRPLSFSRVWSGSLTSGEMSRGYFAYSRLLYRWAFRQWHWSSTRAGEEAVRRAGDDRPYAIPTTFAAGQRSADLGLFDVIYVSDYFRQAKYVNQALQEIETLSDAGLRIGYLHLFSPETTVPNGVPPRLFELQLEGKVTQVSYDDAAETKLLIVNDPAIGMFLDQSRSTIRTRRSIVIEHKLPTLTSSEPRTATVYSQAIRNLDRFFDTSFEVTGGTEEDYDRLSGQVPSHRMLPRELIWHTHIRSQPAKIRPPQGKPVVGFHSYGNIYRWPNNVNVFRKVYDSPTFATKLYGYLKQPIEKFGLESFEHLQLADVSEIDEATFLADIDFWVYFPHHRLEDQIWSSVLSAMHAGKVVILPHRLEPIYGGAAVYSRPEDVPGVVSRLTSEPDLFVASATDSKMFIDRGYKVEHLLARVSALLH